MKKRIIGTMVILAASAYIFTTKATPNDEYSSFLSINSIEALTATERVCYFDGNDNGVCKPEVGGGSNGSSCVSGWFGNDCTGTTTIEIP